MENYLTESALDDILFKIYGFRFINNFTVNRYKIDWYCSQLSIAIEFDGYFHYNDAHTQYRDMCKDEILRKMNVTVIRIPYFVQISTETLLSIFNNSSDICIEWNQQYSHGFINPKALLPANFNENGISKFINDLLKVQENVRLKILSSLIDRATTFKKGSDFEKLCIVLPKSLLNNISSSIELSDPGLLFQLEINLMSFN